MESYGGDMRADHVATTSSFPTDGGHHQHDDRQDHRHHQNFNGEQNEPPGYQFNSNPNNSLHLSGQKRQHPQSNGGEYGGFVKLYVVGIPRAATEQDVSAVFGEYGHIVDIILVKDKRTGLQQEYCFVKYAALDQAERAIVAFNSHYIFPGAMIPMKVKYAGGERERLGISSVQVHKLYVGCVSRQALKWEIEEIFTPFGVVEEVFIVRDEFKQNRGCAFVQFSCRDMAIAAINALHGIYMMKGCDQPLIVRFADPKKPRVGDSRPAPHFNDPSNGHMMPNEMHQMKSLHPGCKTGIMTSNGTSPAPHAFNSIAEIENSAECDWSEHVSPDGVLYYYNCVTCESRWEIPEEYALYEQELDDLEEQQQNSIAQTLSSPDVSET
ncbi:hypothetical protein ABFS83_04G005300 [Erythranthe nasuta]